MKHLTRMSFHSIDAASAQPLSRERMKAIKGGGGNCYFYCAGYNYTTITIVSSCDYSYCKAVEIPYCTCM